MVSSAAMNEELIWYQWPMNIINALIIRASWASATSAASPLGRSKRMAMYISISPSAHARDFSAFLTSVALEVAPACSMLLKAMSGYFSFKAAFSPSSIVSVVESFSSSFRRISRPVMPCSVCSLLTWLSVKPFCRIRLVTSAVSKISLTSYSSMVPPVKSRPRRRPPATDTISAARMMTTGTSLSFLYSATAEKPEKFLYGRV